MLPLCMMVNVEVQNLSLAGIGRHGKQRVVALSIQFGWRYVWSASQISILPSFDFCSDIKTRFGRASCIASTVQPTMLAHFYRVVVIATSLICYDSSSVPFTPASKSFVCRRRYFCTTAGITVWLESSEGKKSWQDFVLIMASMTVTSSMVSRGDV